MIKCPFTEVRKTMRETGFREKNQSFILYMLSSGGISAINGNVEEASSCPYRFGFKNET